MDLSLKLVAVGWDLQLWTHSSHFRSDSKDKPNTEKWVAVGGGLHFFSIAKRVAEVDGKKVNDFWAVGNDHVLYHRKSWTDVWTARSDAKGVKDVAVFGKDVIAVDLKGQLVKLGITGWTQVPSNHKIQNLCGSSSLKKIYGVGEDKMIYERNSIDGDGDDWSLSEMGGQGPLIALTEFGSGGGGDFFGIGLDGKLKFRVKHPWYFIWIDACDQFGENHLGHYSIRNITWFGSDE